MTEITTSPARVVLLFVLSHLLLAYTSLIRLPTFPNATSVAIGENSTFMAESRPVFVCHRYPDDYAKVDGHKCEYMLKRLYRSRNYRTLKRYGPQMRHMGWEDEDCGIYLDSLDDRASGLISYRDIYMTVLQIFERCRRIGRGGELQNFVPGFVVEVLSAVDDSDASDAESATISQE